MHKSVFFKPWVVSAGFDSLSTGFRAQKWADPVQKTAYFMSWGWGYGDQPDQINVVTAIFKNPKPE